MKLKNKEGKTTSNRKKMFAIHEEFHQECQKQSQKRSESYPSKSTLADSKRKSISKPEFRRPTGREVSKPFSHVSFQQ